MKILVSKKLLGFLITTALFITTAHAQTTTPIDDYILDKMKNHHLPGVSIAVIKDGKIALAKAYGFANIDKDIPNTPNTIQRISSISKPVTATAIMKLWEEGLFQLEDPINNYLPFPVTNPFYPDVPITFRMLLSHTSSVNFGYFLVNGSLTQVDFPPGTAPELGPYLQSYFVPGGSLYIDSISYLHFQPGTHYEYSNFGYALLGYLVEQISGMPFNEYCNQNIFQPLCMTNTAWYLSELDTNIVARPYRLHGSQFIDLNFSENPEYPSNMLKTTAVDLSKFMLMHLNYGILDGTRIIDSTTEVMMRTIQEVIFPYLSIIHDHQPFNFQSAQCFGFMHFIEYSNNNEEIFIKNGGGAGVTTFSSFNPGDNTVVTVFSNVTDYPEQESAVGDIHIELDVSVTNTISSAGAPALNCSYLLNPCEQNADYWKNNSSHWIFSSLSMKLGTKHYYTKNQTLDLLNRPVNGDACIVLGKALIAAKLNIAQGSELSPIVLTYNAAMNLIGDHRLPYDNPVSFSSATGIQMRALAATLDSYNSGSLNTTPCSGIPSSITRSNPVSEIDKTAILYSLSVFPNPSSRNATISFSLAQTEKVSLKLFDMSGRLVKAWVDKVFEKGEHRINWDAENMNAGIYIVKMKALNFSETKKLFVVK